MLTSTTVFIKLRMWRQVTDHRKAYNWSLQYSISELATLGIQNEQDAPDTVAEDRGQSGLTKNMHRFFFPGFQGLSHWPLSLRQLAFRVATGTAAWGLSPPTSTARCTGTQQIQPAPAHVLFTPSNTRCERSTSLLLSLLPFVTTRKFYDIIRRLTAANISDQHVCFSPGVP